MPTTIAHVSVQPRAVAAFELEARATTIVYAMSGAAQLGPQALTAGQVATSREQRSLVALGAGDLVFEALVLRALPIGEPAISRGPFIMTALENIARAFADFHSGRFASVPAA